MFCVSPIAENLHSRPITTIEQPSYKLLIFILGPFTGHRLESKINRSIFIPLRHAWLGGHIWWENLRDYRGRLVAGDAAENSRVWSWFMETDRCADSAAVKHARCVPLCLSCRRWSRLDVRRCAAVQHSACIRRAELKHKALTSCDPRWITRLVVDLQFFLVALFQAACAWISSRFVPPDMDGPPLAESEAWSLVQWEGRTRGAFLETDAGRERATPPWPCRDLWALSFIPSRRLKNTFAGSFCNPKELNAVHCRHHEDYLPADNSCEVQAIRQDPTAACVMCRILSRDATRFKIW